MRWMQACFCIRQANYWEYLNKSYKETAGKWWGCYHSDLLQAYKGWMTKNLYQKESEGPKTLLGFLYNFNNREWTIKNKKDWFVTPFYWK